MTTALTATCPTCGSTQGKACRDGGTPTAPHPARREALDNLRTVSLSVFFVIRDVGPLRRGDLVVGEQPHAGSPGVKVLRRHGDESNLPRIIHASAAVWVGWAAEFNPNLFNPNEALEAFPV
ncbi:hypothetical protein [Curtobacterium sp. MCSS17_016]|uniref:zinc finger domain-containing protein n=1 Tax=Curtobacterium sp. MCSS17_016 TaxID=2175644 RepID=UPI000DB1E8A0|nr:hypothetical protein [Curtobacterium sp. MCSS17_016]WIE81327.1 hypothetical protein DEJ19_019020 [Curtobacterium sp. MCSS17_016]